MERQANPVRRVARVETSSPPASRWFSLDPMVILLVLGLDTLLFGAEAGSGMVFWFILVLPAALFVTISSMLMQHLRRGDPWSQALIKGLVLGALTAIPTAIPSFLVTGLMALAGLARRPGSPS